MKYLFQFIFLLIISLQFQHCDQLKNIKISHSSNEPVIYNNQSFCFQNILSDIVSDKEIAIIKNLLVKLQPQKINFTSENLSIFFNAGVDYNADIPVSIIESDPNVEHHIIQIVKKYFRNSLNFYKNSSDRDQYYIDFKNKNENELFIQYLNPNKEEDSKFLQDSNIDVHINFHKGYMAIIFKETYYNENHWLNQKVSIKNDVLYFGDYMTFNNALIKLDVASMNVLPNEIRTIPNIKDNQNFKVSDPNHITYGNLLYHLLNKDIDPILPVLNALKKHSSMTLLPEFRFSSISNIEHIHRNDNRTIYFEINRDIQNATIEILDRPIKIGDLEVSDSQDDIKRIHSGIKVSLNLFDYYDFKFIWHFILQDKPILQYYALDVNEIKETDTINLGNIMYIFLSKNDEKLNFLKKMAKFRNIEHHPNLTHIYEHIPSVSDSTDNIFFIVGFNNF